MIEFRIIGDHQIKWKIDQIINNNKLDCRIIHVTQVDYINNNPDRIGYNIQFENQEDAVMFRLLYND